jgi:hypothetical protein
MPDFPSSQQLFRVARDEVLARNSRLRREIVEKRGSDANALTAAGVAVGDAVVGQLVRFAADLFIDTAKGKCLDRLLFDRYGLLRKATSPAVGDVILTTPTPSSVGFTVQVGQVFSTSDGRNFQATAARVFPLGSSGPMDVPVQSVLAGLSQQAPVHAINQGTVPGAPSNLVVDNPAATAGADDEESDDAFAARGKRFYTTSQRGTLTAIERAALDVLGVRSASAFEAVEGDGSPARIVELIVADAFTDMLVDVVHGTQIYQTQSQQLALTVQSALSNVRAAGIKVIARVARVDLLGVTVLPRYRRGANVENANAGARAVAVAYTNSLMPGQTWDPNGIVSLLRSVPGVEVLGGEVVAPSLPQPTGELRVWRTSNNLVSVGC